jgi:hypothetical protein
MKRLGNFTAILVATLFIALSLSSNVSANKAELLTDLNNYAQTSEKADFSKVEVKGNRLIVHIDDGYVETVNEYGLESYLQNTYKQVNKYQKKNNTNLAIDFKDKASGTFAKSSHSGKGWYKSSDGKSNFNFKTGEVE